MNNKKCLLSALLLGVSGVYFNNNYLNEVDVLADNVKGIIPAGKSDLIGSASEKPKAKSSLKYMHYFEKYGEMYGIDPYLLMAIACTESNGNPDCKYGANYGLMQINFKGDRSIKAYNFKTNSYETVKITSSSQLLGEKSVDFNIRVGAMQLQEKARELFFNPSASVQGYNFGQNGFKRAIAYYVSNGNVSEGKNMSLKDSRIENYIKSNDTDWITRKFNGKTALEIYTSNGGGGTASYVSDVLSYYRGEDKKPWIMDLDGNKHIMNEEKVEELPPVPPAPPVEENPNPPSEPIPPTVEPEAPELPPTVPSDGKPVITREEQYIGVGDSYNPLKGIKAIDKEDGDLSHYVIVTKNTVNTSKEGIYEVSYAVLDNDGNRTDTSFKTVVKPRRKGFAQITAKDVEIYEGEKFNPLKGIKAIDDEDGDLTRHLIVTYNNVNTSKKGVYKVNYAVLDSDGNRTDKEIKVTVKSKTNNAPDILVSDKEQSIGATINPLEGAKAIDKEDGDLTRHLIVTKNTTDINNPGTYEISYAVLDSDGNRTDKTITNTVK